MTLNWLDESVEHSKVPTFDDFKVPGTYFSIDGGVWVGLVLEYHEPKYNIGPESYPTIFILGWNSNHSRELKTTIWNLDNFNMGFYYKFLKPVEE